MARKFIYDSGRMDGGLNNAKDATEIQGNQLADCQNVIFDDKNRPEKRPPIITNATSGQAWKTGIIESAAVAPVETLYTYQKSNGSKYFIVYSGTTVSYSTDRVNWTALGTSFSSTYKMQFETFKDVLIMTNGIDAPYYWDGVTTSALKIGQVGLAFGAAGSTTNGVHKFKVTYEDEADTPNVYSYNVTNEITITDTKVVTISQIPLGPDWAVKRKVWATKAGGSTYFNIQVSDGYMNATDTTASFTLADAVLETYQAYATYAANAITITPPIARFATVFDSRLFFGHGSAVPSNYYYSEIDSFEDFMPESTQAINISDGEFITAFKSFKAANQLLCWKKKGLYGIFPQSDTYTYRSLSIQGCDFSDSVQEFNLSDEYGERDTMLFANKSGVWEWTGNAVRKISETPKGSSIQKTWETAKQREMEFKKNIINTTANWNASTLPSSDNAVNNFAEVANDTLTFDADIFGFNEDLVGHDIKASCWDATNKRMWVMYDIGGGNFRLGYSTWDSTNKIFAHITDAAAFSYANITVKMKHNVNDACLYGITSDLAGTGYIWKYTIATNTFATSKTYTTTSLSGTVYSKQYSASGTLASYLIIQVSHRTAVTNGIGYDLTLEKEGNTPRSTYSLPTTGATLPAGKYNAYAPTGDKTTVSYTRTGNIDFDIVRFSGVDYLFYTEHGVKTAGQLWGTGVAEKTIKYINLATWGTATTHSISTLHPSRAFINYSSYDGSLYVTTSDTYDTFNREQTSWLHKITSTSAYTDLFGVNTDSYPYDLRKIVYNGTWFVGVAVNNITGTEYIWKKQGETGINTYTALTLTLYDNATYNIPIIANPDGNLFYFINNADKKIYEWNTTDAAATDIGLQAAQTVVDIFMIIGDIADYVPTMLFIQYGSDTKSYWRGVWGNYTLKGYWLKTGTNNLDCGANSAYLQSIEALETRSEDDDFEYYLFSHTAASQALTPYITNTFTEVEAGEGPLDGLPQYTPGTGTQLLSLIGAKRYIHMYIIMTFDVYHDLSGSDATAFSNALPNIDNLVTNWIDVEGGVTLPKTQISSIVFNDKYFLSVVEPRPTDTNTYSELTNNVILVLDRLKRWSVWRGRGCYASSFCVYDNVLYWGDCYVTSVGAYSDYLYALGNKGEVVLADIDVAGIGSTAAIDAYVTTKDFTSFAQFDNGSRKKQLRHIYITSDKFISTGTYNLTFEYRADEAKYEDSDGTNVVGNDKWTTKTLSVADPKNTGFLNGRIDFANEQPGKRYQFRFRNNTINQDIGFIDFTIEGFVLHGRD